MKRLGMALCACALWLSACQDSASEQNQREATRASPRPNAVADELGDPLTQTVKFTASDGETLHAILTATGDFSARPLIVEFSPYGGGSGVPDFGPDYTHVFVHARGTGESTGQWSAIGPRDQLDVSEFLSWACTQPWSNGHIGLYGFSASAIAVYNAMHLPLACVDAAALMAGTHELYRDLIYPGGLFNLVPTVVVGLGVGSPILASLPNRFAAGQSPLDSLTAGLGVLTLAPEILQHPSIDEYWQERRQRPSANHFPVLADTGFYDVESRGPFQSYQMLRDQGVPVHLRVLGAHDGFPAGSAGPFVEYRRWFDRYLLNQDNGIDREAPVQMLIGHGGYHALMSGEFSTLEATDWPIPGTHWQALYLNESRGGGAFSLNDGQLSLSPAEPASSQVWPAVTSLVSSTDPNTFAAVASSAAGTPLFDGLPFLSQMAWVEPTALSYTTAPLAQDIDVIGPASLEVHITNGLPETDLYAVIADVSPDGLTHAVAIGRLRSSYPSIDLDHSLIDEQGQVVQPYADHAQKTYATPGQQSFYQIEFWPIGNRFQAGHRLRLYLLGAATNYLPAPGINLLHSGGITPSRLLLPLQAGVEWPAL